MRRSEYFASPEGSLGEFPTYPPYSELPFTSLKRRKQGNQFVKWSMRAVLASPLIVLVLWSTCAILFTSSQQQPTNKQQARPHKQSSSHSKVKPPKPQVQYMSPQGGIPPPPQGNGYAQGYMMQPPPEQSYLAAQAQPVQGGQFLAVHQEPNDQRLLGVPLTQVNPEQPPSLAIPQTVVTPEQFMATHRDANRIPVIAPMGSTNTIPVIGPMGSANTPPQVILQQGQQLSQQGQQQQQPLGESQAPPLLPVPLGATGYGDSAHPLGATVVNHRPPPRGDVLPEPLGATVHLRPSPRAVLNAPPQQQVYYYDVKEATKNGQLQIPDVVYDSNGHSIPLQALQGAQIFLEPPIQQLAQEPPQQMVMPTQIKQWGESTTQDQSIIVSTVAVMALLVGALSARRLRSRSFLSSCIENESLEDDVAYDTAYTTTDNSYNTFGGWKGDLEKFDV
jgi:hypothetical protein